MSATEKVVISPTTLPRVVRGEWVKLRGLRATWWLLGLILVLPPLISFLWALNVPPASSARLAELDAVVGAVTSSLAEALVLLVLFGTHVAAHEFESRTITTTMAAIPRRWPVVVAKVVVVLVATLVVALASVFVSFFICAAVIPTGSPVGFGDPGILGVILGCVLYQSTTAVIALCAALVIRSRLGAIALTFGFLYVLPGALNLIPLVATQTLSHTFPGPASSALTSVVPDVGQLDYGASVVSIVAWTTVWIVSAIVATQRRDV